MSGNGVRLVAREGIPVLFGLLVLATISYVSAGLFLALLFVILFALYFSCMYNIFQMSG